MSADCCPECDSTNSEVMDEYYDDDNGENLVAYECQDCGCCWTHRIWSDSEIIVDEHGDKCVADEIDEDAEIEKKTKVSQHPQSA